MQASVEGSWRPGICRDAPDGDDSQAGNWADLRNRCSKAETIAEPLHQRIGSQVRRSVAEKFHHPPKSTKKGPQKLKPPNGCGTVRLISALVASAGKCGNGGAHYDSGSVQNLPGSAPSPTAGAPFQCPDVAKTHLTGLICSAWKVKIKCTSGQYQREGQGERDNHTQPKLYHGLADDNYLSSSGKVKLLRLSCRNFFFKLLE